MSSIRQNSIYKNKSSKTRNLRPDPLFILGILLGFCNFLYSAGLSTPNVQMVVGNLKIGQTYSLKQAGGIPFKTAYKGTSMVDLKITVEKPERNDGEYEPLDDISWIQIEKDRFSVDPGQEIQTDIFITIPNDEKYLGKKYWVGICPQTAAPKDSPAGIAFGLKIFCVLKLSIAPKPPTPEELRQLQKLKFAGALSATISPERIFLYNVPLGRQINIKKEYNEVIKIVNPTDNEITVDLEVSSPKILGIFAPEGYEESPDYNFIKLGSQKLILKANSIKEIPLYLRIPIQEIHYNRKYFFIVKIRFTNQYMLIVNYVKIYVTTPQMESDLKTP